MTLVGLIVGGHKLACIVPDNYLVGLQGYTGLTDEQGMYFPYGGPPGMTVGAHMGSVVFPIDILFLRNGVVAMIVANVRPGNPGIWTFDGCTGVLEVRGGWCADHGVGIGTRLEGPL